MPEVFVGKAADFEDRGRRIVAFGDHEIGVFRVDGAFYAYENYCVHQGGPICQGKLLGRVEEVLADDKTSKGFKFAENGLNVVCPWHGYEYDIRTGRHAGDRNVRLRSYEVKVQGPDVFVVV
jgi:nitrite reductase/ring-hydroxylating ferredoxin subunit